MGGLNGWNFACKVRTCTAGEVRNELPILLYGPHGLAWQRHTADIVEQVCLQHPCCCISTIMPQMHIEGIYCLRMSSIPIHACHARVQLIMQHGVHIGM